MRRVALALASAILLSSFVLGSVAAFSLQGTPGITRYPAAGALSKVRSISTLLKAEEEPMSYEMDTEDEEVEQHLGEAVSSASAVDRPASTNRINGDNNRFDALLKSVGLDSTQIRHAARLPNSRAISSLDVFCNRELRMDGIRAIGFDMDYTLAAYKQPAFDRLAFDGAKKKLVDAFGYPAEVLDFEYDHNGWTRGLIIDTVRGNFLKIDRHKYVRVANHGFNRISSTTRKHLYSRTFNKVMSFSEKCTFPLTSCG